MMNGVTIICPCCGDLCEIEEKEEEISVQDVDSTEKYLRTIHYSYCHGCGSEYATAGQVRKNLDEPLRR